VGRWVNVAAGDDVVAAVPDLTGLFPAPAATAGDPGTGVSDAGGFGAGGVLENRTVDNGSAPHEAAHYLADETVGRPVAEALAGRGAPEPADADGGARRGRGAG
jgi:hypothetical protein